MAVTFCRACGAPITQGTTVCDQCGADPDQTVTRPGVPAASSGRYATCPTCGTQNPAFAWKCAKCGTTLHQDTTTFASGANSSHQLGVMDIALGVFLGMLAFSLVSGFVWFLVLQALVSDT